MSDDSDDGYLPGESFLNNNKDYIYNNEEEYESNKDINYDDNYDINYKDKFLIEHSQENFNYTFYHKSRYENDKNNDNYFENDNYYDNNYECLYNYDYYNFNNKNKYYKNNFNYSNKKKYYNNNKYKSLSFKTYNNEDLSSFGIEFKKWLMNKICKEKKKIKFDNKKNIIKEIIDSFYKYNNKCINKNKGNLTKNEKEKENEYITIDIKDIKIKKIVSKDINIEFNIIINEEFNVLFIKKYIDIKVKGEINNNNSKFYFKLKQYKLSLNDKFCQNKNKINNDGIILDEKKEVGEYCDTLELDLNPKDNYKEERKDSNEDNEINSKSLDEELKMCINEIIERHYY